MTIDTPEACAAVMDSSAWNIFQEGGLATTYVSMDAEEAAGVAERCFGISGDFMRFATEKDDTFHISSPDGRRFVLKVANPEENTQEIDLQLQALKYIEKHDPSIPVPRVFHSVDGQWLPSIVDKAGQHRHLRLLSYVDGKPLDSHDSTPSERERVGETLARLRLALDGFSHPSDTRVLAWDVKHLLTLEPLLQGVTDTRQRHLLAKGLARFAQIAPQLRSLRSQVLHNDFSRSNIVVEPGTPDFVTGIIDFGDVVRTAVAIDVSTALLNQLPRGDDARAMDDIFADGRDILRGYLRFADLTEEELTLIPHLAMGRVIARALLTTWRARMFPENAEYILRNTQQGWAQLEWFVDRPLERVSNALL